MNSWPREISALSRSGACAGFRPPKLIITLGRSAGALPLASVIRAQRAGARLGLMCAKCKIRKAIVTGSLCALCAAGLTVAGSLSHHGAHATGVVITSAVAVGPVHADGPEQPHTPEIEATELPGTETEILERHVLVLDHPRHGQLSVSNYLG